MRLQCPRCQVFSNFIPGDDVNCPNCGLPIYWMEPVDRFDDWEWEWMDIDVFEEENKE